MHQDSTDLTAYLEQKCDAAFQRIVERHNALVHGVAFRMTQNRELAQEITQSVFILLARKAHSVRGNQLPGWLHHSAHWEAKNALRKHVRGQRLNQKYQQHMDTSEHSTEQWNQLAPYLDSAVSKLSSADKQIVILRYFKSLSFREISRTTGLTEEACKKRSQRSLERLKAILNHQGIRTSLPALTTMIAAYGLLPSPASAATITKLAIASIGSTSTITSSLLKFISIMTTKQIAATAIVCTIAAISAVKLTKGNSPNNDSEHPRNQTTSTSSRSTTKNATAKMGNTITPKNRTQTNSTGLTSLKRPRLDAAGLITLQQNPAEILTAHASGEAENWTRADADLLVAWAAQDPQAALNWVQSAEFGVSYGDLIGAVATGILIKNGKEAMETFLAEHQNAPQLSPKHQGNLAQNLFYHMGRADTIDTAIEMLANSGDSTLAGALIQGIEGTQNKISAIDGLEAKGIPVSPSYWSLQEDIHENPRFWTDWAWQRNSDILYDTITAWHRQNPEEAKRWIQERIPQSDPRRTEVDELIQTRETPIEPQPEE